MKKMLLAVAVTTTILFAGCKSGGGDPKAVLISFFEAMGKKDFAAAKKLATKESEQMFGFMEMGMNMAKDKDKDKDMDKFDKSKMEFGEVKIEGDKATVPVKEKSSGESTNFILKKEDGNWKVAFDKASLMQMGTDKMKEGGKDLDTQSIIDSVNGGLDKLKSMNTDSLAEEMKKGMDKLKEIQQQNPEAAKKMEEAMKKLKESSEKLKQ